MLACDECVAWLPLSGGRMDGSRRKSAVGCSGRVIDQRLRIILTARLLTYNRFWLKVKWLRLRRLLHHYPVHRAGVLVHRRPLLHLRGAKRKRKRRTDYFPSIGSKTYFWMR